MNETDKWLKKISKAEKNYKEYHELIKKIREYYKNEKNNKHNIFWSSIETLKPFLYFKQPKPYVERKEKTSDAVASTACQILEKALEWDLSQFDFDGVIKYVRNDFLLSGMGLCYEKYTPTFKKILQEVAVEKDGVLAVEQVQAEILDSEKVETLYIDPEDFIADSEKVGIWEDCTWVARRIHMTREDVVEQFGDKVKQFLIIDDEEDPKKDTKVYQIWDKTDRRILYITEDCPEFLRVDEDILKVDGFFPFPKPIFATTTNDSLIPVPDYSQIESMLKELDGITSRMSKIMQALKISGAYDNSFPELKNILNKDITLVSLSDFKKLRESGGISGVIDFMPIEQYVASLQALAERRQDLTQQIYEITGVSDIMRGNSDPNETATAVTKKTNFGTLRNQDRQNDMQRFITDLLKIKAEMICEQFSPETLAGFVKNEDPNLVMQAIELLKTDKMRGMVLGIETDTSFNQSEDMQKISDAITLINTMITNAFQVVSAQPLLLPLYRQMIETVVVTLPNARQYEPVIEQVFNQIQQQLSQPQPEQPNIELEKIKVEREKMQLDAMESQATNILKEKQLRLDFMKLQQESRKDLDDSFLKNKEMEIQKDLKQQEINNNLDVNSNISTGYVRGF